MVTTSSSSRVSFSEQISANASIIMNGFLLPARRLQRGSSRTRSERAKPFEHILVVGDTAKLPSSSSRRECFSLFEPPVLRSCNMCKRVQRLWHTMREVVQ
ncbi:hypothetical protein K469DRAFT_198572 [Zopfia rhizophila CBS 207.26]|uniref:Uncharacterized protein n=1 Tax=Zopfia rhizophila CBS 207.26 TaxID=1314779 RepID=A0A6A6E0T1_9PEZI|nr:hypothetical protein K469DRAFT_198572 [Zopfia rhizophila CBS 207.26]